MTTLKLVSKILLIYAACIAALAISTKSLADGCDTDAGTQIISLAMVPTPTPSPAVPAPETPKPVQTPEQTILPVMKYNYPAEDQRCLSRGIKSICPKKLCTLGRIAFCEVIQNMVDDDTGVYKDSIRYVLLMKSEFFGYDPNAKRTDENNKIADYVMNTWMQEKNGDRSNRLLPKDAVHFSFSDDGKNIHVYDKDWNVVYSSEEEGTRRGNA